MLPFCSFAGGSLYDIPVVHGIRHTDVLCCGWTVVNAFNICPNLALLKYQSDPNEQQTLLMDFMQCIKVSLVAVQETLMQPGMV